MIAATATIIQSARQEARQGCGLYIAPDGQVVVAPQPMPGWQRVGIAALKLKPGPVRLWDERSAA